MIKNEGYVQRLYHGTDPNSARKIVTEGIKLFVNKAIGDFGAGFYMTPNFYEAMAHSMKRRNRVKGSVPVVICFDVDGILWNCIKIQKYDSRDDFDWQQYVFMQRVLEKDDFSYDIVIGPIADGKMPDCVEMCKENPMYNKKAFFNAISYGRKEIGVQYTIKTEAGISVLKNPALLDEEGRVVT